MKRTQPQLREDALAIWQAGVEAVGSERLIGETVSVADGSLHIGEQSISLAEVSRIVVVGAGKAGAGMAAGIETALAGIAREKQLQGWVNVPEDCLRPLRYITLHGARPAGMNEPTEAGVFGSQKILELVSSLGPADLCLCLLSGGGSALLPAPVEAISLADKQFLTKHLSAAGANIEELNTVRKQLSRIKGGGLAHACRAGRLTTLIISDVIGDPLDVIASGPTVPDSKTPQDALDILDRFHSRTAGVSPAVFEYLERCGSESLRAAALHTPASERTCATGFASAPSRADTGGASGTQEAFSNGERSCRATNLVIGNNALAVDAAGIEAERRGYSHAMMAATSLEGPAEEVGRHLAEMAMRMRGESGPDCLITGGEPTVQLVAAAERGQGGRNQQLVLAALIRLLEASSGDPADALDAIALLSGGTDGEDGPTDAAGALIDPLVLRAMHEQGFDPREFLRYNDAYRFFDPLDDALIKTGPTHTNVCDLRVVVVSQ